MTVMAVMTGTTVVMTVISDDSDDSDGGDDSEDSGSGQDLTEGSSYSGVPTSGSGVGQDLSEKGMRATGKKESGEEDVLDDEDRGNDEEPPGKGKGPEIAKTIAGKRIISDGFNSVDNITVIDRR